VFEKSRQLEMIKLRSVRPFVGVFLVVLVVLGVQVVSLVVYSKTAGASTAPIGAGDVNVETVLFPGEGFKTKVVLGDVVLRLVDAGVIDLDKFHRIYSTRGGMTKEQLRLLTEPSPGPLTLTPSSANFLINILWPLGIANNNRILDEAAGYKGVANLASTGGWPLGKEDSMAYFNKLEIVKLTPRQQIILEEVARNTYRPCCNNPTAFPDCNHGAALLALLELGASQGLSVDELYTLALQASTLWFPQQYIEIALLMKTGNKDYWSNAREIMGPRYSSYSGWSQNVHEPLKQEGLLPKTGGGGNCGI